MLSYSHFFSKYISVYAIFNDRRFNDTLAFNNWALFAFMRIKSLLKRFFFSKFREIAPKYSPFFPFRVDNFQKITEEYCRIVSLDCVAIYVKSLCISLLYKTVFWQYTNENDMHSEALFLLINSLSILCLGRARSIRKRIYIILTTLIPTFIL